VNISLETQSVLGHPWRWKRVSELKMQQAEMDRKFTKQHPAYRALMSQIGELTQQQKSLEGKVGDLRRRNRSCST
jgi:tyrosine-protein kinase Etk/Wzc